MPLHSLERATSYNSQTFENDVFLTNKCEYYKYLLQTPNIQKAIKSDWQVYLFDCQSLVYKFLVS